MNTKSVVAGGIFLIGLGVLIFTGSWRIGIIPSPIPSPSINEKVRFTVNTKEIDVRIQKIPPSSLNKSSRFSSASKMNVGLVSCTYQVLSMFDNMSPQDWGMAKAQMRAVMIVVPAVYLVRIHVPVLAILGEYNTLIPVEKSITIYQQYLGEAGNQAFTYKVFAADHSIRIGEKFADGYFDLMLNWLRNLPMGKRK